MPPARHALTRLAILITVSLIGLASAGPACAQAIDPEGRLVREVKVVGLENTPEQLVRNALRTEVGKPYRAATAGEDITRLTFLGRFDTVVTKIEDNGDGSINVIFNVTEQATLLAMRFVGAKRFTTPELMTQVLLAPGDPIFELALGDPCVALEALKKRVEHAGRSRLALAHLVAKDQGVQTVAIAPL